MILLFIQEILTIFKLKKYLRIIIVYMLDYIMKMVIFDRKHVEVTNQGYAPGRYPDFINMT
jgi:hypothetical protein